MEKLYESGKRFERLLYTSIFIILASFLFYNLSVAITVDQNQKRYILLTEFRDYLSENKDYFSEALKIEKQYELYKKEKSTQSQPENQKNIQEKLKKQNIIRKKLGLKEIDNSSIANQLSLDDVKYQLLSLDNINRIRTFFGVDLGKDIDSANEMYRELYRKITIRKFLYENDLMEYFLNLQDKKIEDIINILNEKINAIDDGMVKVFNIDTPIQFPFSVGDMKSKISLYNIHSASMVIIPIFLVIWLGSITMTRSRELYLLKKTAYLMATYPHVLNIFNFIDPDFITSKEIRSQYILSKMGDNKNAKKIKIDAFIFFLIRTLFSISFFLLMLFPFYYGVFLVRESLTPLDVFMMSPCLLINLLQVITFIINESSICSNTFISENSHHDII
ncbi:hypothetical protein [Pectobacterium brasiliense]|uniref:hypothetical protein n=1 Tax=Pectobacterium brasiliense TaxID=180957 RepID=UPI001969728D|nr:hypothetical protein [Pectobacterium brasiliense]MBN3160183.1 hypothetical protein [Pectobacterium brasiliense]